MNNGKYIMLKDGTTPILFPAHLTHEEVAKGFGGKESIFSAGFFEVSAKPDEEDNYNISVSVYGKSTSLNLISTPNDVFFIKKLLRN